MAQYPKIYRFLCNPRYEGDRRKTMIKTYRPLGYWWRRRAALNAKWRRIERRFEQMSPVEAFSKPRLLNQIINSTYKLE